MKKILAILVTMLAAALSAHATLNVVATLPDFGAIARAIGEDKVAVTVLAKPTEDPHFVDARPSFVVSLRNADVLIDGGAELEIGWLPPLLQNAQTRTRDCFAGDSSYERAGERHARGGRRACAGESALHD